MAKINIAKPSINHDPQTVKELNDYIRYMALWLIQDPERGHLHLDINYYHVENMLTKREFFSFVMAKVHQFNSDVIFEETENYLQQVEE